MTQEQKDSNNNQSLPPKTGGSIKYWTPPSYAIGPAMARAMWCEGKDSLLAKEIRMIAKRGLKLLNGQWFYNVWNIPLGADGITPEIKRVMCIDWQQYHVRIHLFFNDKHNYNLIFDDDPITGEWSIKNIGNVELTDWNLVYLPTAGQIICGASDKTRKSEKR